MASPFRTSGYALTEAGDYQTLADGLSRLIYQEPDSTAAETTVAIASESGGSVLEEGGGAILAQGITALAASIGPFHDDAIFPDWIGKGATWGPGFKTEVQCVTSPQEMRATMWQYPQIRADAATGVHDPYDADATAHNWQTLISFYRARQGSLYGFRVSDPTDRSTHHDHYSTPDTSDYRHRHAIGAGDGTNADWQLVKHYRAPAHSESGFSHLRRLRPITRPKQGTVTIWVNGTQQTEGTDYTIDYAGGMVRFTSAPTKGRRIEWAGEFHVPMRFGAEVDRWMAFSVRSTDYYEPGEVPLVEIRELPEFSEHPYEGGYFAGTISSGDYCISLSNGAVQRLNGSGGGGQVYLPSKDHLLDGEPHLMIYNGGGSSYALVDADTLSTLHTLTAGSWVQCSIRANNTWAVVEA